MSARRGWEYVADETEDEERARLDRAWTVLEKGLLPNLDYLIAGSKNKDFLKSIRRALVEERVGMETRLTELYGEDVTQ